jgi:uncharacterized membrane protein
LISIPGSCNIENVVGVIPKGRIRTTAGLALVPTNYVQKYVAVFFFFFGATAPIGALAYFHKTLRFTSVY